MAREFLDYTPETGISYYTEYDEASDTMFLHAETDVEPLLDYCEKLRNENIYSTKDELFHYAKIPPIVQLILLKKGLNIFSNDPTILKKCRQEIEANFPRLKTSYAKHV